MQRGVCDIMSNDQLLSKHLMPCSY
jgi:hypothetical protein